jgi:hypothetical protein
MDDPALDNGMFIDGDIREATTTGQPDPKQSLADGNTWRRR